MLTLTKKTDQALIALAYLAKRASADSVRQDESEQRDTGGVAGGGVAGGGGCVCAREIADAFGLPLPQLMNIMKDLVRAKLIRSLRGACGGYVLARSPRQVTLLEVITAIEGPIRLTECCSGSLPILGQGCEVSGHCPVRGPMAKLHGRLQDFFAGVTLAELMDSPCSDAMAIVPVPDIQPIHSTVV